jgi:hypothetical protein
MSTVKPRNKIPLASKSGDFATPVSPARNEWIITSKLSGR